MIEPPAEVVRLDQNQYRLWLAAQTASDLADLVEAGAIATDAFPPPPAPPGEQPVNRLRQEVDAIVRYRHDQRRAEAAADLGVTIVHVLPGVDDVPAAMASLPRRTVPQDPPQAPTDAVSLMDGGTGHARPDVAFDDHGAVVQTPVEADPEWELHGDVLYVVGVPEPSVRQALASTRR